MHHRCQKHTLENAVLVKLLLFVLIIFCCLTVHAFYFEEFQEMRISFFMSGRIAGNVCRSHKQLGDGST